MAIYLTSDTHYNHVNILAYCNRPFKDVNHMNEVLIANWNAVVKPEDIIYHLGDVTMGDRSLLPGIVARLNGYKVLIRGNHDKPAPRMLAAGFNEVHEALVIQHDGYDIYLDHHPHPEFVDLIPKGMGPTPKTKYQLCGHVHSDWVTYGSIIVNVGVDVWDYRPITIDQAIGALNV